MTKPELKLTGCQVQRKKHTRALFRAASGVMAQGRVSTDYKVLALHVTDPGISPQYSIRSSKPHPQSRARSKPEYCQMWHKQTKTCNDPYQLPFWPNLHIFYLWRGHSWVLSLGEGIGVILKILSLLG